MNEINFNVKVHEQGYVILDLNNREEFKTEHDGALVVFDKRMTINDDYLHNAWLDVVYEMTRDEVALVTLLEDEEGFDVWECEFCYAEEVGDVIASRSMTGYKVQDIKYLRRSEDEK